MRFSQSKKLLYFPQKNYIIGVYKEGYICRSSRSAFGDDENGKSSPHLPQAVENGMQIRLKPLKENHPRDEHAAFTVLVAGEVAQSKKGPFYQAILPLFRKWRDNLRRELQKNMGDRPTVDPH